MRVKATELLCRISLCGVLAAAGAGCEREQRPLGAASGASLGAPEYTVVANISSPPGLSTVSDVAPKLAKAELSPEELYVKNCSACHQVSGAGVPGVFPPLVNSPYVLSDNTDRMASIMLYGLAGPIHVLGTQYVSAMAPLGATLSDDELAKVATYVRASWGNKAAPVAPSVFAEMRKKWGTHGPFNIQELGEEK